MKTAFFSYKDSCEVKEPVTVHNGEAKNLI